MKLDGDVMRQAVRVALAEDLGTGDVTSMSLVPATACGRARLVFREEGVVAGLAVAEETFRQLAEDIDWTALRQDGDDVAAGAAIAEVSGPARFLLSGERVALNFLQRLSGIATLTRWCVRAVAGHPVKVLDTRKTTPGLRRLEKYAVRVGGGGNHRMGLYDQVLIKDNHLRMLLTEAKGLEDAVGLAVRRARAQACEGMRIEVEAETLGMARAALDAGADIIMLDNMTDADMREAVRMVREHRAREGSDIPITEASGGLDVECLPNVAATGVDTLSLGMITHSAPALDIAMEWV